MAGSGNKSAACAGISAAQAARFILRRRLHDRGAISPGGAEGIATDFVFQIDQLRRVELVDRPGFQLDHSCLRVTEDGRRYAVEQRRAATPVVLVFRQLDVVALDPLLEDEGSRDEICLFSADKRRSTLKATRSWARSASIKAY